MHGIGCRYAGLRWVFSALFAPDGGARAVSGLEILALVALVLGLVGILFVLVNGRAGQSVAAGVDCRIDRP